MTAIWLVRDSILSGDHQTLRTAAPRRALHNSRPQRCRTKSRKSWMSHESSSKTASSSSTGAQSPPNKVTSSHVLCSAHSITRINSWKEFLSISRAVGVGFLVMGFIGYAVKLIHIPINNILVLHPFFGGPWLMIRLLEIDV
jgi:protein translocase SEC61 complex gamma subunit